jgi:TP901 family phage tail tape measure protein
MAKPIRIPITFTSDPRAIKKTQQQLKDFGKAAGKVFAGVGLAVAGVAALSVKAFADFDAAMVKSTAIMGNVSDAMRNDMSDAAREVAKTTTFSATQAAESFFFLASAGMDAATSIKALPKVSAFAQAGMFDMALATDLLTDAQSALGLSVDDTGQNIENLTRVSDVLVKANTLANASVQQFSEALTNKAGAALKIVNKDIEEGVAVLAAFADQGIKGDIAGSQLGIVLRDLSTKAINFEGQFKSAGVAVFDSAGNMNNMADIVGDLEGALTGMSDKVQKATLLQMGFSDKSLGSLQALLGTSDAIRGYEAALRSSAGTTEEVSRNQLEGFSAQLSLLKSKFVDIAIEIGSKLAPALLVFVQAMDPILASLAPAMVGLFAALLPVFEQVMGQMPMLIDAIIPIIPAFGEITTVILTFAEVILPILSGALNAVIPFVTGVTGAFAENGDITMALIATVAGFVVGLKLFAIATSAATAAQIRLNIAMIANPIGLVVAAVVALTAALVYFFGFTELGQKVWGDFVWFMRKAFNGFVINVAEGINIIVDHFGDMVNVVIKGLNLLVKARNALMKDSKPIAMIAEVKFAGVKVPDVLTKPVVYNFPTKGFGAGSQLQAGANDRLTGGGGAGNIRNNIPMMGGMPSLFGAGQGIGQNFKYEGPETGFQGRTAGGGATYNNAVTVNQGIMSGVGTSDAEAGRTIQKYLDAYSRTGGR